MKKKVFGSIFRKILGWVLVILGLAGLLLPFLPGIILLIIGTSLLGVPLFKKLKKNKKQG